MRQYAHAVLLVVVLQVLSLVAGANGWGFPGRWHRSALKVSVGFPARCIFYTAVHTTGDMPTRQNYPDRTEWLPGVRISPLFLFLDALVTIAALFGFRWLLRYEAGRTACLGYALGAAAGVANSLSNMLLVLGELPAWVAAPIWLVGVPLLVCLLTRRTRSAWLSVLFLAAAAFVAPWAYVCAERFRANNGFSFAATSVAELHATWEDMLYLPLAAIAVIGSLVLLMRRLVPFFRSREAVASFKEHPQPTPR